MVAYLEKTDGNAEFHEIIDFLTRSSIHYALTISLVVSTTFVEQFWMTAKSKTINNVRYITATVAGKPVSISEASIRSDLQFQKALVGIMEVTIQAKQIQALKTQIKKLKKKAKPVISLHNAWIKSVSVKKRLARKKSLKTKLMQKESVSKQGRKPAKS
ncbi:hypothetical protein Tco_0720728, partial [Tanacetum coccineum]